jgi:cytochrome c556
MKTPVLLVLLSALAVAASSQKTKSSHSSAANEPRGHQPSGHEIQANAASLDRRLPLPLLPHMAEHQRANMRDHLAAVQEIIAAMSQGDFAGVAKASARIESSEHMRQMCSHMGQGAAGFTEMALNFHRTADTIGAAARKKDQKEVLTALSTTVSTCVKCHETYRQQVVDETTWSRLTAAKPSN